ncbi:MAG: hypothetical protein GXO79_01060 [Chlorobi bacterium]|nr:hypothetical protein [Chlorobiota bacterium]
MLKSVKINYHHLNGWQDELLVDEITKRVYAKFIKDGIVFLKQINLKTGNIETEFQIDNHTFPKNIKVRDNNDYYLYKTFNDDPYNDLYRQI